MASHIIILLAMGMLVLGFVVGLLIYPWLFRLNKK